MRRKTKLKKTPQLRINMKITHEFVRTWIRWVSLSLFAGAVIYKFKKIIDAGKVDIDDDEEESYEEGGTTEPTSPEAPENETYEE